MVLIFAQSTAVALIFAQSTAMVLLCSARNFKTISQLINELWANEISRDMRLRSVSSGCPVLQQPLALIIKIQNNIYCFPRHNTPICRLEFGKYNFIRTVHWRCYIHILWCVLLNLFSNLFCPYTSGILYKLWSNHTIATMTVKNMGTA